MAVKRERMSPSPPVSTKEDLTCEYPAATDEAVANDSEVDNEASDAETGAEVEQKPLSHQQAMEHFKDALAEIIVVCNRSLDLSTPSTSQTVRCRNYAVLNAPEHSADTARET